MFADVAIRVLKDGHTRARSRMRAMSENLSCPSLTLDGGKTPYRKGRSRGERPDSDDGIPYELPMHDWRLSRHILDLQAYGIDVDGRDISL
jgi:hypothetical protein